MANIHILALCSLLTCCVDLGQRGFIPVEGKHELFYWLYRSKHTDKDPLIIWIDGGPGCSSEQAMFCEMGPFRLNNDLSIKEFEFSWTLTSNLLFLDQPLGTGFSNTADINSIPYNEKGVTKHLYEFFKGFMGMYPEFIKRPVIIMGHSYAGHFIPPFVEYVMKNDAQLLNIQALAIGDGYMSPTAIYQSYREFAHRHNLIDERTYEISYYYTLLCKGALYMNWTKIAHYICNKLFDYIVAGRFNPMDISGKGMNTTLFDRLMYDTDFIKQIGLDGRDWSNCNGDVGERMKYDEFTDVSTSVDYIISTKMPILFYYGGNDFLCNIDSFEYFLKQLSWKGKDFILQSNVIPWFVDGLQKAQYQQYGNIYLIKIDNASHIAFYNEPAFGLDMVLRMTNSIINNK